MCPEDKLVDGLDEVLVKLLALCFLLGPVVGVGLCIDTVDVLVVLNQGLDGVRRQLVSNLVSQYHVDVHNVGLEVDELVVEDGLNQRVGVFPELRLGGLGQHQRSQGPDGIWRRQGLGQTSLVLRYTVEWALDPVDALECLREPRLYLGSEDHVDGGSTGSKGSCRSRE